MGSGGAGLAPKRTVRSCPRRRDPPRGGRRRALVSREAAGSKPPPPPPGLRLPFDHRPVKRKRGETRGRRRAGVWEARAVHARRAAGGRWEGGGRRIATLPTSPMLPMRKLRCRLLSLPYPSLSLLRRGGHAPRYPPCVRARCGVCTRGQASRILVFVRAFLCLSACAWARPGALLANGRRWRPALRGLLAMPRAAKAPGALAGTW